MLTAIVIDAMDVRGMDRFWRDATRGRTGGLDLRFVAAADPKPAHKNRLHLDLAGGPDWADEVERLLALGATRIDIGQGDVPWDVLADPEGNEFCVVRPGHHGVLTDTGLASICLDVTEEDRQAQPAFWRSLAQWHAVESHDWGARLRRTPTSPVCLLMGPPAAPKAGRNRLRLEVTRPDREPGEFLDAGGNEFHVAHRPPARTPGTDAGEGGGTSAGRSAAFRVDLGEGDLVVARPVDGTGVEHPAGRVQGLVGDGQVEHGQVLPQVGDGARPGDGDHVRSRCSASSGAGGTS